MFAFKKKIEICYCAIFVFALLFCSCVTQSDKKLKVIATEDENVFSCTFDGIKHEFILDLPDKPEGASLILMLHGYGNNASSFREMVHLEEQAKKRGYAVVYVTGASNPSDATSSQGWNSGIGNSSNDDVAFLCSLVAYLEESYGFDTKETYAVGFSNGAFMTYRLAVEASDTFEAIVSVAGKMPKAIWDERSENNLISVFQITGEKDDVVPKVADQSANYSVDPAIESVIAYWVETNGLASETGETIGNDSYLIKYCNDHMSKMVWSLRIKDGRHSWPDENIHGFDTNKLILDFLDEQK